MKKFEVILAHDNPIVLGHKINQIPLLPGVALIDFIYRVLSKVINVTTISLSNCIFHESIAFIQPLDKKLRLIIDDEALPHKVTIYSIAVTQSDQLLNEWILNFECEIVENEIKDFRKKIDLVNLKQTAEKTSSFSAIYNELRAVGITHDAFMQVNGKVYHADQFILLELELSKNATKYIDKFYFHPAMFDAATISSIIPVYQEIIDSKHPFIPITIECFHAINSLPHNCYVLINKKEVQFLDDIMKASFSIYDSNGEVIAEITRLVNKKIRNNSHQSVQSSMVTKVDINENNHSLKEILIDLLSEYVPEGVNFSDSENFYNLGLDSKSLISIVHKLEHLMGMQLYPTLLFEYNNLNKLVHYLSKHNPTSSFKVNKDVETKNTQKVRFLKPTWSELKLPDSHNLDLHDDQSKELLIFSEDIIQIAQLRNSDFIKQSQLRIIQVLQANDYFMHDENTYQLNQDDELQIERLLQVLWAQGVSPRNVIYCRELFNDQINISETVNLSILRPALLLKNLQRLKLKSISYLHCYSYDENTINFDFTLGPYLKSLKLENPYFNFQLIGLNDTIPKSLHQKKLVELFFGLESGIYLLNDNLIYELNYQEIVINIDKDFHIYNGNIIITGGAGNIGISIAQYLVEKMNATVYLLGRSKQLPSNAVKLFESLPANKLKYIQCDVSNKAQLQFAFQQLRDQKIDAVFHCAGVLEDALHENTQQEVFEKILKPKLQGTIFLYELCKDLKIQHLFLFSSLTSVIGNIGQTQYATANAFQDEFARFISINRISNATFPYVLSINWPLWKEGGMANADTKRILKDKWGLESLTTHEALKYLMCISDSLLPQVVISNEVIEKFLKSKNAFISNSILNNDKNIVEYNDIAIIGISGQYPMADNLDEFWVNLVTGKDCISEYPKDRFENSFYQWGGFLENIDKFDSLFFGISPKDAKIMDPQERLFLQTAWHTFEDAGYGKILRNQYKSIGVFVGAMFSLYQLNVDRVPNQQDPQLANSSFASIANRVSYCLDLNGPSLTLDTMCSSSLTALHYACESIKSGECDLALAGGVNIISHPIKYHELLKRNFLSKVGRCKVFSADADGYVPAEGVGAVLLKRLEDAIRDNDHIYGIIKGSAINHSGKSDAYTIPSIEYQSKLISSVLQKTNISPESISYFEAHGTGTALGDPIELQSITNAYRTKNNLKQYCGLGSLKSNIGHAESAAGIAALTKVLLQLKHKKLVPTIHSAPINPGINLKESPCYIQKNCVAWSTTGYPRRAALNGFGAGGTNAHFILEEYILNRNKGQHDNLSYLFLFSAKTEIALENLIKKFHQWLEDKDKQIDLQSMSLTLALGRDHFQYRIAIIARSINELKNQLCNGDRTSYKATEKDLISLCDDSEKNLPVLAYYYQLGENIDWPKIYSKKIWYKISLPTYPFAESSHWVGINNVLEKNSIDELRLNFYTYKWFQTNENLSTKEFEDEFVKTKFILIDINNERYEKLKADGFGNDNILITQEIESKQISTHHYGFDINNQDQCQYLLKKIISFLGNSKITIFYFVSDKNFYENSQDSFDLELQNSFFKFHYFCQILIHTKLNIPIDIKYFYRTSDSRPVCAAISGYIKTLMRENPKINGQVIKINAYNYSATNFSEIIKSELSQPKPHEVDISYSSGKRYVKGYEKVNLNMSFETNHHFIEKDGVYLIIGGLGKLGRLFAEYIASIRKVHLVLVGRKQFSDYQDLKLQLEQNNSTAIYYSCDVTDYNSVVELINKIKSNHSRINGIINSSSVLEFSSIHNKSIKEILNTLNSKCIGTNNLDLATQNERLDWFVCFSSLASVIGFPEGCDYAFGNSYLDEFIEKRNKLVKQSKRFGRTIVLNWPVWKDGGMIKNNPETQESWEAWMIKSQGVIPMSRDSGFAAFEAVMASEYSQMIVAEGYDHLIQQTLKKGFGLDERGTKESIKKPLSSNVKSSISLFTISKVEKILISTVSELLEISQKQIDVIKSFTDYGFDSVSLISFSECLTEKFNIEILPSLFFSENSISKLSRHLVEYYFSKEVNISEKKPVASGLEYAFRDYDKPPINKNKVRSQNYGQDDIAIVGMDGKFPNSENLDIFWQHLLNGSDLISEIPEDRWDWKKYYNQQSGKDHSHSKWGGFLPDVKSFDADFFKISDTEAIMMDPQHRIFLEVAWRAIESAGQPPEVLRGKPIGVFVGVQFNDYQNKLFDNHQTNFYIATGNSHALIANRISYLLDLSGPSESIDTACSSALVAINRAINSIKLGECESAIVGATTCILNPMSYVVTSQLGIISPEGKCKVFDASANGYVKGEGAGALWIMPLKMAIEGKYPIHGLIKGVGVNHGGNSTSLTAPNIKAQQQLIVNTYKKSNVSIDSISYIETHGTGTLLGDSIEIESIKAAIQELSPHSTVQCSLGSVKSNAGHLEPAAGIISVIKVLLMLKYKTKVKNLHFNTVSPYIKIEDTIFKIQNDCEMWSSSLSDDGEILPRRAGVSSFGFGGTNAHLILEEYVRSDRNDSINKPYYLCTLSAKTNSALFQRIKELEQFLSSNHEQNIESISYTLNVGRSHYKHRCAIIVENVLELLELLRSITSGHTTKGVYFSSEQNLEVLTPLHNEILEYLQNELIKFKLEPKTYLKKLQSLGLLYTQQYELNWHSIHLDESTQKVSLPSYPFEKKQFWLLSETQKYNKQALLGKNFSTTDLYRFELKLNKDDFYFSEHKINAQSVLPGVIILEILAELYIYLFPLEKNFLIKNILWLKPINSQNLNKKIFINVKSYTQKLNFEVVNEHDVFVKGEIDNINIPKDHLADIDMSIIKHGFGDYISSDMIYMQFLENGMDYGPSFQTIKKAYRNENEIISEIKLSNPFKNTIHLWNYHPGLIDAALQTCALFFEQCKGVGYLYALEEVCLWQEMPIEETFYAFLKKTSDGRVSLKLYNEVGKIHVYIRNIIIKNKSNNNAYLTCLKPYWVESYLPIQKKNNSNELRILIIKTSGTHEKLIHDALMHQYDISQVTVIEWNNMYDLLDTQSNIDYENVYIIFHEYTEVENLATQMAVCSKELLFFLKFLANQKKSQDLYLKFITIDAFMKKISPIASALTGFIHSFHQENPLINVSCIDVCGESTNSLEIGVMIKNEPFHRDSTITIIDEKCKRLIRKFLTHTFDLIDKKCIQKNGVYLIIGGAKGVGFEFGKFLAKNYQAKLIFVGRAHEIEQDKIKIIQDLGGNVQYIKADIGIMSEMKTALDDIQSKYSRVNGVIHSALVLDDKPILRVDISSLEKVFNPKVQGSLNLWLLFKDLPLDFMLIFSSAQSYMNNGGQSNYAVASIFQDQLAKVLRLQSSFPIKVVNWGYWGTVGVVATEYYRQQMQNKGILSLDANEAFKVLEQFLASSLEDCALLSVTTEIIASLTLPEVSIKDQQADYREFNIGLLELEKFTALSLFYSFQKSGYFNQSGLSYQVNQLIELLSVQFVYRQLFASIVRIFHQNKFIIHDESMDMIIMPETFIKIDADKLDRIKVEILTRHPTLRPHIDLVCQCTTNILLLLCGQVRHTEVLFQKNQFMLIEQVYTHHPISKEIIKQLVSFIITAVLKHKQKNPSSVFNLLEIGAGTGSASVEIIRALREKNLQINYCFTDISQAFLKKAISTPELNYEGIQFKCLDITCDLMSQGFEQNSIDIVLANNVIHATGNIVKSLEHINILLNNGGVVLLNELTQTSSFMTVTFGLTPEWWKHDQELETIPYSPLLTLKNWKNILTKLKFNDIQTPLASEIEELYHAQQIIIANKIEDKKAKKIEGFKKLQNYLKSIFADILKIPVTEIMNDVNLGDYGLDSLITLEATERLQQVFTSITNTTLFQYSTIDQLVQYIFDKDFIIVTNKFSESTEPSDFQPTNSIDQIVSKKFNDIAVIGLSGRFPGGESIEEFWNLLLNKESAISEIPADRRNEFIHGQRGGFLRNVKNFDSLFFNIAPHEAEKMDPQERLFLEIIWELLECSGYTKDHLASCDFNVGTFVGAMNTDYSLYTAQCKNQIQNNYSALWSIANRISYFFNLVGPSLTVDTACASSLTAIHMACESLKNKECNLAIAGGVNLILHPNHYYMLDEINMLTTKNQSFPFSNDSDGMIIGEGAGALLLKPLSNAIEDNDIIYGVIKGSHINSSGRTKGYMVPNPYIQEKLMRDTLRRAQITESSISYIETASTGTKIGDEIEIEALQRVYGNTLKSIGTIKPNIGHLESSAGVAGVIKVLLQMKYQLLIPAINAKKINQDPLLQHSSFRLIEQISQWSSQSAHPRRAAISAFGAGGSNAHMIIEEYLQESINRTIEQVHYLCVISAKNSDSLIMRLRELYRYLSTKHTLPLQDIAYTLAVKREHFNHRLSIIAISTEELIISLKEILEGKCLDNVLMSSGKVQINNNIKFSEIEKNAIEQLHKLDVSQQKLYFEKLMTLAELYIQGYSVNWNMVFRNQICQLVLLPTYSFERQYYWRGESSFSIHTGDSVIDNSEKMISISENDISIQDYLLTFTAKLLKISKDVLDPAESFLEYGFDSISLAQLIDDIESSFQVILSPVDFMHHPTIEKLAEYLNILFQQNTSNVREN